MSQFSNIQQFPPNVHPPLFGLMQSNDRTGGANSNNISLDDIFDEFLFANEQRDIVKSEGQKGKSNYDNSKDDYGDEYGGKDDYGDDDSFDGDGDGDGEDITDENGQIKKKKRSRGQQRYMTEEQKVERRERNREHAKRSRVRKKFLLESLQQSVQALQDENEKLREAIREHLPQEAESLLSTCSDGATNSSILADRPDEATKTLDDPDYSLVKALQTAQQNFVITDPSMPDNPIVYASQGFLSLTGYNLDQVLGRNCRFLQGPGTDPRTVARIRSGIEKGEDTTTVLLNYRADQTTFWNQFFVAALRDGEGNIVNYLGVQCKVSDDYATAFITHEQSEERGR